MKDRGSQYHTKARRLNLVVALMFAAISCACQRGSVTVGNTTSDNLVVVNAPVAGRISRIAVRENMNVAENQVLFEINPEAPAGASSTATQSPTPFLPNVNTRTADTLTREKERAAVEVARVQALVSAGSAPQSQLDAAQAVYQRAQERAQALPPPSPAIRATPETAATPEIKIVAVRATTSGVLRVLNTREGAQVTANQPVATIAVKQ